MVVLGSSVNYQLRSCRSLNSTVISLLSLFETGNALKSENPQHRATGKLVTRFEEYSSSDAERQ